MRDRHLQTSSTLAHTRVAARRKLLAAGHSEIYLSLIVSLVICCIHNLSLILSYINASFGFDWARIISEIDC